MRLRTLGLLALESSKLTRSKPLLLLAYLALEGMQPRRSLAQLFWPEAADPMDSLTVALSQIRKAAPEAIEADAHTARTTLRSDAYELLEALDSGQSEAAISLYAGPFGAGVHLPGMGVELEEWLFKTREFLAGRVRRAILDLAELEAANGRFDAAARRAEEAQHLRGAAALEPDEIARMYMLLLAGGSPLIGDLRNEAEGFGLELPSSPQEARKRLQRSASSEDVQTTLNRSTSFVGREKELAEVMALLIGKECRLLTLVGPGGVGKTRLALQVAQEASRSDAFPDGVSVARLEALASADHLATSLLTALRLEAPAAEGLEALAGALANRRMLLLLDNFEHLTSAAPQLSELLGRCPNLCLLVTSRERLGLEEEWLFALEGLAFPHSEVSPEEAARFAATQLFMQRASRVKQGFRLSPDDLPHLLKIFHHTDGLPLALELAATWVRVMPVADIAVELSRDLDLLSTDLRDVPERHRSMRQALESSWQLLSRRDQEGLAKLAVFAGGFTREAAATVAGVTIPMLAALLDRSLLHAGHAGRYSLHPLVQQFARQKLTQIGDEAEIRASHARYFVALAEQTEPFTQATWLDRLQADHDNLRAALDWAQQQGQAALGLRLGASLGRFWIARGHMQEGSERLRNLLSLPSEGVPQPARASALLGLGTLLHQLGQVLQAIPFLEASLTLWRELGDVPGTATVLNNLAWVRFGLGDFGQAEQHAQEALNLHRQGGDLRGMAVAHNNLGWIAQARGQVQSAQQYFNEALALRRTLGDERGVAFTQINLAWVERYCGRPKEARALLKQAKEALSHLGDEQLLGWAYSQEGQLSLAEGVLMPARETLEESERLFRKVGSEPGLLHALMPLAQVHGIMGEFDTAQAYVTEALELTNRAGFSVWRSWALYSAVRVAQEGGQLEQAEALLLQSLHLRGQLGDQNGIAECLETLALLRVAAAPEYAARLLAQAEGLRKRAGLASSSGVVGAMEQLNQALGEAGVKAIWKTVAQDIDAELARVMAEEALSPDPILPKT